MSHTHKGRLLCVSVSSLVFLTNQSGTCCNDCTQTYNFIWQCGTRSLKNKKLNKKSFLEEKIKPCASSTVPHWDCNSKGVLDRVKGSEMLLPVVQCRVVRPFYHLSRLLFNGVEKKKAMQFVFFGPDELKMWLCSSNEKQETKESNTVYDNVLPLTTMPRPPSLKEYTKGLSHTIYFCTCDTKKQMYQGRKWGFSF